MTLVDMKKTLKIFVLYFLINYSCTAQQMVQIPKDAYKLKINQKQFMDKNLNKLLKEIKPEIKMVDGTLNSPDYFTFKFVNYTDYIAGKKSGKKYISIYVYVKEKIDWKKENRPEGKEYLWTNDDVAKYGNYTVVWIRVIGND
jgi:hypothetical protein